jgi:hypothetical protein
MGRGGRYTLSVMAWIAVYAGWSSVLGLVFAAVTGEGLTNGDEVGATVPIGLSTLGYLVLPLVPTIVALWFNDWLRDGAPSRADRERAGRTDPGEVPELSPEAPTEAPTEVAPPPPAGTADRLPVAPTPVRPPVVRDAVVAAAPLGVPELAAAVVGAAGYPVAPVLRGGDEAPAAALADPAPLATSRPASPAPDPAPLDVPAGPVIDPDDPLGVGDLGLTGLDRG